jgi:arylsulfatase A-like enzyme/Flp pilus assembly protein TadD
VRKKAKNRPLLIVAAVVVSAAAVLFLLPRKDRFDRLRGTKDYNVILITMDTTRADRLGCYGFPYVETPTIDLFARRGVRFERCISTTPLTLPAHTSIMTGTVPPFHGVRDNGGFIVPSGIETLAKVFKAQGYATSAFVAAYVLDSKWGLNIGFDTYYDKFDLSRYETVSLGEVQRPANEVIDQVLPWLEQNKAGKFFTWIHLYDPHTPYQPPPPYDQLYPDHPYLGEIAFTDSQIARLWAFLEANGLTENLFLVLTGDHGESLGEHGEGAHGFFVYQAALHVPLVFVTPFPKLQGVVAPGVVSLVDIMPTLCEMTGAPLPPQVQGKSLVPAFFDPRRTPAEYAYSETYYPRYHYGWSELRAVQDGRYKLILAPVPELFDIVRDPGEEKNLVYLEKEAYQEMRVAAEGFIARTSQNAYELDVSKVDEETREKLAALGYIGSFSDPSRLKGLKLADPKDKIGVFNDLSHAREMGLEGKADDAIRMLQGIIADDPKIGDAHFALGNLYLRKRKYMDAIAAFEKVLELKPDDSFAVMNVAGAYQSMGRFDDAERFVLEYLKTGFRDSQLLYILGNMNYRQKNYDRAIGYFEQCLTENPRSASSHNGLAAIYIMRDDLARAEEHLKEALALNPRLQSLRYNMAQLLEKRSRFEEAAGYYLQEIQDSPKSYKALFNLSRVYRTLGRAEDELRTLQRITEVEPRFPLTYFYLARFYLNHGERYQEAVDLVLKGLELKPEVSELPLGYFLLADLYNRLGDGARSEEYAAKGRAAAAAAAASVSKKN